MPREDHRRWASAVALRYAEFGEEHYIWNRRESDPQRASEQVNCVNENCMRLSPNQL